MKIVKLFLANKTVRCEDIGKSYTTISPYYENLFLKTMHRYNDEMLLKLLECADLTNSSEILDLGAGTGYNSIFLQMKLKAGKYTLVDISKGMLGIAKKQIIQKSNLIESDMLSYLKGCEEHSFDVIVCCWALKYQPPLEMIKQFQRVIKKDGYIAILLNTSRTLPEIRRIYPKLLEKNVDKIDQLMLPLPNPKNKKVLNRWFKKYKFNEVMSSEGEHEFYFPNAEQLTEFVTSTGALAGFDVMIKLREKEIKTQLVKLFEENKTYKVTHKFVYGIYKQGSLIPYKQDKLS